MSDKAVRTINVPVLTRVEGEGALQVVLSDGSVKHVRLAIFEPPRFFEALLRGRPLEETPDITARICGICPVAYQMTSVHALESALGIVITPEIRALRRLLYCGEWIESHGVHIHLLHIPDFFRLNSVIELAQRFPHEVQRGLRLKKAGNRLLEVLGGRATNPINVAVGGFYRAPRVNELRALTEELKWGLDASVATAKWVAQFDFPDFDRDYEVVALRHPQDYPMNEGRIASSKQLDIPMQEFEDHFQEVQVPHSTALHSVRMPESSSYLVGPLARINLNRDRLMPAARQLSSEINIHWPCTNPFKSIIARCLEVVHAFEEALKIIEEYTGCTPGKIDYTPRAAVGCWVTEAPRGLIYHRYGITDDGLLSFATIVPPTSQNQGQIELDIAEYLPRVLSESDSEIAAACDRLIRSYDPCISCSTHFLKTKIERQ